MNQSTTTFHLRNVVIHFDTSAECAQGKPKCAATAYSCMKGFGGARLKKMTWNRAQKPWRGEAVKFKNTVACRALEGGGLKHALEW